MIPLERWVIQEWDEATRRWVPASEESVALAMAVQSEFPDLGWDQDWEIEVDIEE